ncbi:dTMP kinase [Gluconacetobacter diazotrophicus PA1 5]|uniref:Thymidylate kinase n=2 Tax=Gluconacetobacter diazotrophicus TaxID=33996 RepID=A9HI97_GLUDA|nr:dTMP kinase [Gluconacetobacter diazotrophicus]ACI49829.1 dTMP kinase [Gluconacetobacter diazotrophicus PA1 5]MBB2155845.1 dTMP kinase [Gluconacetobacter diazotrophicus]TWB10322.1 dTMP kinase [Gluconacetobacter diazotrophicus]CAP55741.1 putative thymidylate kinase [Gluconacetobacter diazotrophicus PA1 5]
MAGLFITFEGGEGAGKSTQAQRLEAHLRAAGREVVRTREPGGTPGAEALRQLLLFGGHDLSLRAEILAHFAARCDHVDQLIRPALARGAVVICDRFIDSTLAYQGYGLGRADPGILHLIAVLGAQVGLAPDLTLVLMLERAGALARLRARGGPADRYEAADEAFHARVADGFDTIARAEAGRCVTIAADRPVDVVAGDIARLVDARLETDAPGAA